MIIVLPYLGIINVYKRSFQIRTRIRRVMKNKFTYCSFLTFFPIFSQDKVPVFVCSGIAYKFKCGGCNVIYYGKTNFYSKMAKHHFKVRMCEHLGGFTGNRMKEDNDSAVKKHLLLCNHSSGFDDFKQQQ